MSASSHVLAHCAFCLGGDRECRCDCHAADRAVKEAFFPDRRPGACLCQCHEKPPGPCRCRCGFAEPYTDEEIAELRHQHGDWAQPTPVRVRLLAAIDQMRLLARLERQRVLDEVFAAISKELDRGNVADMAGLNRAGVLVAALQSPDENDAEAINAVIDAAKRRRP